MNATQHRRTLWRRLSEAFAARVRTRGSRSWGWRLLAPGAFLLAGALFVTSAISSGGTDLRAGRYQDLPGLIISQKNQVERLRAQAAALTSQVDALTAGLGRRGAVKQAQQRADRLKVPAGIEPASGSGLTVTLNDAPKEIQRTANVDASQLIVHQQDIQAVANALWAGGATAVTIQGQRVVSTTGIKCVGNSVILHDVPYAPPYVISAIGPTSDLLASLDASAYIQAYLSDVASYDLGWNVRTESDLHMPGYTGSTELHYAKPITTAR
ncbi:MAG: DUF881 domain-containing protein [Nocardioidaceae bacterium]